MALNNKNRRSSGSSPVGVGIVAFLLGFLFAFIVLFGSIFGVGYVALTTDINRVFEVFGLDNKNSEYDSSDPDSEKYNYINADQAPNIYTLITEVIKMANEGLGEINLNRIDALAPITDTVLNMGYEFIDDVVDFDKEYFEDVPLTSIIDVVKNSIYYVHTGKIIETLNNKMGYSISLGEIPIVGYMIDGLEAEYATVTGKDESFRLPVLYDYYLNDGTAIGYGRTVADPEGVSAYPANFGSDYSYIHETTLKNEDGDKLYRVYYVPCKVTPTGIEEAEYKVKKLVQEDPNVTFTKNGDTQKLKYIFRTIEFGEDTDFIAVKPQEVNGVETFVLDHSAIIAAKNPSPDATASNRYLGYSYYESYARNYYSGPSPRKENDLMYGVSTVNHINYFRNVAGEMVEYDPLLVSDIMLDALETLDHVPVASVVNASQGEMVRGIFGDTSLGAILDQRVDFNELVNNIKLSTFLTDVRADDKVMSYLVFNVTNVAKDGEGNYTAIYDKDGENIPVTLEVEGGVIKNIYDAESGEKLKGNTVADMSSITNGLSLDVFVDVKADDPIMMYLGYGVTDAYKVEGEDYAYVGTYNGNPVYIYTNEDETVSKVIDEHGTEVDGTKIDEVSDRVNNIMDVLSLPDFIDVNPEEGIMSYIGYGIYDIEESAGTNSGKAYSYVGSYMANGTEVTAYIATEIKEGKPVVTSVWYDGGNIAGTKINKVSERLDNVTDVLAITEFMDIDPEDAIMTYMGYGISKSQTQAGTDALGNAYTHTGVYTTEGGTKINCYMTAVGGKVESAWYIQGDNTRVKINGTKISAVPDRINKMQDTLTIGEIVTVDDEKSSMILKAIKDTTISGLDDRINELKVCDVLEPTQVEESSVLRQLKDTLIVNLGDAIDEVLIQRIYADNVYGVPENSDPFDAETIPFDPSYLYYEKDKNNDLVLTKINCGGLAGTNYDNALGKLTQTDWDNRGTKKYYTYGKATGMWRLILYRMDETTGTKTEKAYTLNNFNNMVTACGETVNNSTLGDLKDAGIVSDSANLNKTVKVVYNGATAYVKVENGTVKPTLNASEATLMKDLTLKQLIDAITLLNN